MRSSFLHHSLNLVFTQGKLHNFFIFGMACSQELTKSRFSENLQEILWNHFSYDLDRNIAWFGIPTIFRKIFRQRTKNLGITQFSIPIIIAYLTASRGIKNSSHIERFFPHEVELSGIYSRSVK